MAERLDLRLPEGTKERWKNEADRQSLTLTEYVVRRVESDPFAALIEREMRAGFGRLESLVIELLETPPAPEVGSGFTPSPPQSLPTKFPQPWDPTCYDAELHRNGVTCNGCGGSFRAKT